MLKKILVIEDDTGILNNIKAILEMEEYVVEVVRNGRDTFEKVEAFKPDLIIMDILLSGEDGRKICRALKRSHNFNMIPVLMMSAHPEAKISAKECGADGFIEKPYDIGELVQIVQELIQRSEQSQVSSMHA